MVFSNEGHSYEDFLDTQELNNFIKDFDKVSKAKMLDLASHLDVGGLNYLILELQAKQVEIFFILVCHSLPLETLLWLEYSAKVRLVNVLNSDILINFLIGLEAADIVLFVEDFDDIIKDRILSLLPISIRDMVLKRMKYPEDTAGRMMKSNYIVIYENQTAQEALRTIRDYKGRESYQLIAVVDETGMFQGTVLLQDLLRLKPNKQIINENYINHYVEVNDHLDVTVAMFKSYVVSAIPVLSEGRIVGIISIQHIVNFIQYENEEDLMSISGINVHSASMNVLSGVYSRLPSLLINLCMAFLISFVTSKFDVLLHYHTVIAFLLNVIPSLSGALAVQTMSVTIQSITKGFVNYRNYNLFILKEVLIAALISVIIMFIGVVLSWLLFNNIYISFYFGASILITLITTGFIGASMPIFLEYLGLDSSVSAGAMLTSLTDVLGYLIFLVISFHFLL